MYGYKTCFFRQHLYWTHTKCNATSANVNQKRKKQVYIKDTDLQSVCIVSSSDEDAIVLMAAIANNYGGRRPRREQWLNASLYWKIKVPTDDTFATSRDLSKYIQVNWKKRIVCARNHSVNHAIMFDRLNKRRHKLQKCWRTSSDIS